ncbi:hypothetical protein, partial [Methanobrevibacter millerae]
ALTLAELSASSIAFMIIALPVIFELNRPKLAEMLENVGFHRMAKYYHTNNTIDILWDAIEYLNLGELDNVPFEQRLIFALFYLSSINTNVLFTSHLIINPNSDLYESLNLILKSPDLDKGLREIQIESKRIKQNGYESLTGSPSPIENHGKLLRDAYEHAKMCWEAGNYVEFLKNWLIMDFIIFSLSGIIIDALGEEIVDALLNLNNTNKG